jgi:hypothetical protein
MKINGIEMQDAGYDRPEPEVVQTPSSSKDIKKKKCYATIYSNDQEMPLDLKGIRAGDKLMLVCLVDVKELTSVDNEKKYEPKERFTLEILKCGCEKTSEKEPVEMDDDELEEAVTGKKKEE